VQVRAVEPRSWLRTAYYEDGWFSGRDVATAFNLLATDNGTIVLDRSLGKPLKLGPGDSITLSFGGVVKTLKVAGFFGPEPSDQQQSFAGPQYTSQYWSYISADLYNESASSVSATAKILLKLKGGAGGKSVAEQIRNLGDSRVSYVQSFAEDWESSQKDVVAVSSIDVQRLGIVFAFLAASVGTALVSIISMKERDREATIMSVRGLSYKQLVTMFLTENMALVTFATALGLLVGLIVTNGNISSTNSYATSLVQHRLVFPLDNALLLFSCILFIFLMTVVPILIMSRKYVTKLERMVRLR
jgi:ABC-type antimicrobial peptide transport system permease subunit